MRSSRFLFRSFPAWAFLFSSVAFSQVTFERTFGSSTYDNDLNSAENGQGAAFPTSDGGYAVVGSFGAGASDQDVMFVKMNSSASTYWVKTYSTAGDDEWGFSGMQTSEGGYGIVGTFNDGSNKIYFIKTTSDGSISWTKKYAAPSSVANGFSAVQTADEGYLIGATAKTDGAGPRFYDMYMIKMASDGTAQWAKAYSGTNGGNDFGFQANSTADGGYAIAGYLSNASGNTDVFFVKTTSDGTLSWADGINLGGTDAAYSFAQTADGGYILTGTAGSNPDMLLMKLDNTGAWVWSKTYDPSSTNSEGRSVKETADGGFIIAGSRSSSSQYDMLLLKTTSNGTLSWCKVFDGTAASTNEYGSSVVQTADDGYLISGYKDDPNSTKQVLYLVKTNSDGVATSSSCATTGSTTPVVTAKTATVVNTPTVTSSYNAITSGGTAAAPAIAAKNPCNNTTTLPVEMLNFRDSCNAGAVKLEWSTASEINNDYFSIERSVDGKYFQPIGKIYGAGNSSVIRNYEFTDDHPPSLDEEGQGIKYYRIRQVDFNGQYEYFGPVSVRCNSSQTDILPTVSEGLFFITGDISNAEISVYSVIGEKVFSLSRQSVGSVIDIANQASGIYLVKIKTESGVEVKKVVVRH
jgi:hypothetical protein